MLTAGEKNMEEIRRETEVKKHEAMREFCDTTHESLKRLKQSAKEINEKERKFELEMTNYGVIDEWLQELLPYKVFWKVRSDWSKTHRQLETYPLCKFHEIDAKLEQSIWELETLLGDPHAEPIRAKCESLRKEIENYERYSPLIETSSFGIFRDEHWDLLSERTGLGIKPHLTLEKAVEMGLMEHAEVCEEVSAWAVKERKILLKVEAMEDTWQKMKLKFDDAGSGFAKMENEVEIQEQWEEDSKNLKSLQLHKATPEKVRKNIEVLEQTLERVERIMKNYGRFKDMWRVVEGYLTPYFCKHHPKAKEAFGVA